MSPAAGGAAPAQSAAPVVAPAIAEQEPDRAAARRDPAGQADGADPANAAARKTAWGVPAPSPAAAAAAAGNPGGGIIGGDASWPALVDSKRGWPKLGSSDSLKSLSDGSGPSAQEDLIASSVAPHPVLEAKPISASSNPAAALPPNVTAAASSQQNGGTTQSNPVRRSGGNGGNNGGGSRDNGSNGSRRAANNSGGSGSSGSGGDDHRNGGSLNSGCNNSNGDGGSNLNGNSPINGTGGSANESSRDAQSNSNWNNNTRAAGSRNNNDNGEGGNHWNNNSRNSNGGRGRGGYRGRREHERGTNFSPRNYPRVMPYHQQQQPGVYQPSPFHRPPPPPPAAHFMVPQHFVSYASPFSYHGDMQSYPIYLPPVEQFQNMHLVRPTMQPSWVPQDQPNLHEDIKMQIEFYFSTNNLCHDTFLRRHMTDQGWVPIDLILGFNRMRAFTGLVDTSYILDAIRGSEILEVQGNNVRRRNDWAEWLLH